MGFFCNLQVQEHWKSFKEVGLFAIEIYPSVHIHMFYTVCTKQETQTKHNIY